MQTQHSTPLAPYGSMNNLALVAKVGGKAPPVRAITTNPTVVRRAAAQ